MIRKPGSPSNTDQNYYFKQLNIHEVNILLRGLCVADRKGKARGLLRNTVWPGDLLEVSSGGEEGQASIAEAEQLPLSLSLHPRALPAVGCALPPFQPAVFSRLIFSVFSKGNSTSNGNTIFLQMVTLVLKGLFSYLFPCKAEGM